MSAISVIEIALVTQINIAGDTTKFNSFGQARRRLETLAAKDRHLIAVNLGAPNYKQLRGALQNLNYLRNRIAHHERVWNHRNRFAFPDSANKTVLSALGSANNRHVLAFSLIGMATILSKCPKLFDFERRLLDLTAGSLLPQAFLLRSMGFDVS